MPGKCVVPDDHVIHSVPFAPRIGREAGGDFDGSLLLMKKFVVFDRDVPAEQQQGAARLLWNLLFRMITLLLS